MTAAPLPAQRTIQPASITRPQATIQPAGRVGDVSRPSRLVIAVASRPTASSTPIRPAVATVTGRRRGAGAARAAGRGGGGRGGRSGPHVRAGRRGDARGREGVENSDRHAVSSADPGGG